ncbi:hypothetical protein HMN09_00139800 [Mycena chlorophos]|uniref:Uncharacterized protein n=1 Tax=Mycena chlorophos TaxID=658473 RepID=A0A8H6TMM9_MYCCL|nr:hypothetical protein HMN09_00139800 [Mycena chlorophos]
MQEYTFDSPDVLRSGLRDSYLSRIFTTSTTVVSAGFRDNTTLSVEATGAEATINWRAKTFRIGTGSASGGEQTRPVDGLKRKAGFSAARYWRWGEGEEYKVRYAAGAWVVASTSGTFLASLSSATTQILPGRPAPVPVAPMLRLSRSLGDDAQRHFLVLVLLYSETRRLERMNY